MVDVAPSRQEIERRLASLSAGRLRRPVVVLGIAGASVPTRPDSAREAQEGRRHTRAPRARWRRQGRDATGWRCSLLAGERLVHGRRWHHVHNEAQRGEALTQMQEAGLLPAAQGRLCGVCEGAAWSWQHVQALFPQARQVLEDAHWAPDLHRVAQAPDGASGQAVEWVEATMTRRSLGTVGLVLGGWQRMPAQSEEAAQARANGWHALDAHRGPTAYRKLRRGG